MVSLICERIIRHGRKGTNESGKFKKRVYDSSRAVTRFRAGGRRFERHLGDIKIHGLQTKD